MYNHFPQKQNLEQSLAEVGIRYSAQLSQLQLQIDHLQEELQRLNANIRQQASEYQLLLDIKMRLELEIAEYRRLLDGEAETYVEQICLNVLLCPGVQYVTTFQVVNVSSIVELM